MRAFSLAWMDLEGLLSHTSFQNNPEEAGMYVVVCQDVQGSGRIDKASEAYVCEEVVGGR